MPDDYSSTTQTSGVAEVGGSATGEIETRSDRDWFAVTLDAGWRRAGSTGSTWRVRRRFQGRHPEGPVGRRLRGVHDAVTATSSPSRRMTTAARTATAGWSSGRRRTPPTMWRAGAWREREGAYTLSVTAEEVM